MDLATTCRTCLQENLDEPVWIASSIWEFLELDLRMQRIPRVHSLLELPQNVCFECYRSLIAFKRFYTQCRDSEDFWKMKLDNVLVKIHEKVQDNAEPIAHAPIDVMAFEPITKETDITFVEKETELLMETNNISMKVEVADDGMDGDELKQQAEEFEQPVEISDENNDAICKTICKSEIHINSEFEANENIEIEDDASKMEVLNECEFSDDEGRTIPSTESMTSFACGDKDNDDDDANIKETAQHRKCKKKRFQCQHCDKSFDTNHVLHSHEYIHTGIKPFNCDVCGKSFRQKCTLRTHQTLHFGKKIECQECGQMFQCNSHLIRHGRVHRNERPFKCDYDKCSAAFRERQYLLGHQKIHSGVRDHQCEYCAKAFYNRRGLFNHLSDVHGPYHYQCDLCVRAFNKPYKIRRHMQSKHDIELTDVSKYKTNKDPTSGHVDDDSVCKEEA